MKLNIVLYQPAIIQNVGNIARTCLAFNADLHMIRPYGFIFNKSRLNRSSTNHFDKIKLLEYDNWTDFQNKNSGSIFIYTKKGNKTPDDINYETLIKSSQKDNIYIVFGNEQYGVHDEVMNKYFDNWIRIPISESLICLNVSNSVAIACYEIMRQLNYKNLKK